MKTIAKMAVVLTSMLVMAAIVSHAQTVGLRVNVPFQFNVGEKVLPRGQYLILAPQGGTLRIFGPNGEAALAMTNQVSGHRPEGAGVVDFNCYATRCFLSQLWTSRSETGAEVIQGKLERELANAKERFTTIALRGTPYR